MKHGVHGIIFTDSVSYGMLWERTAGAYRLATELRSQGYKIQVIDCWSFMTLESDDIAKTLLDKFMGSETMFVGFSSTFMTAGHQLGFNRNPESNRRAHNHRHRGTNALGSPVSTLLAIKAHVHAFNPKIDIIVGGARAVEQDHISTVKMLGYGEKHMTDYMKWKSGKMPLLSPKIEHNRRLFDYASKAEGFDFANSTIRWEKEDCIQAGESLPIEVSRGCIFRCKFCSYPLNGKSKVDYLKDRTVFEEELKRNYELFGTTNYVLADDTYNDTTEKLEWMNSVVKNLPFRMRFTTYVRLDLVASHPEQEDLLLENGIAGAFFGIESLYRPAAQAIGKGMATERLVETLHRLRAKWKDDVNTTAGFILGLPNDTYATMEKWISRAVDERFPLHSFEFTPLGIVDKTKVKQVFYSELELDPMKFGYKLDPTSIWTNDKYNTSYGGCNDLGRQATLYMEETGRSAITSFHQLTAMGLGYTKEEMTRLKRIGIITGRMKGLMFNRYYSYLDDLYALEVE